MAAKNKKPSKVVSKNWGLRAIIKNKFKLPTEPDAYKIIPGRSFLHVKVGNDTFPCLDPNAIIFYQKMIKGDLEKYGIHVPVLVTNHTVSIELTGLPEPESKPATPLLVCKAHPRYKAIRPPIVDCAECRKIYHKQRARSKR